MTDGRAARATLTSVANPRLRAAAALRDRRDRVRTGRLLVDGAREVARALDAGVTLVEAFVVAGPSPDPEVAGVAARAASLGVPLVPVARDLLARLAYGERASGIVAVAIAPEASLAGLGLPATAPLVGVLEGVEKPGNLGAVCRSADGAGLDALIAAGGAPPPPIHGTQTPCVHRWVPSSRSRSRSRRPPTSWPGSANAGCESSWRASTGACPTRTWI